ncbi:MAG: HNH endonuclease [Chloroflexi bacterium]|nr:HNH endonuclease [Chloroflexota bacterium]
MRRPFCADPFGVHKGQRVKATIRDHVIPLSLGGTDDESNEQGLCFTCHQRKTAIDGSRRRGGINL